MFRFQGRADDVSIADVKAPPSEREFDTIQLAKISGAVGFIIGAHRHGIFQTRRRPRMDSGDMRAADLHRTIPLAYPSKDVRNVGRHGDVRVEK